MQQTPILLMSDSPELPSGLARITRDLAMHISNDLPRFRVGTLGRAGHGSRTLPWAQYNFAPTPQDQWGVAALPGAWEDFAGDTPGVIMTIQDPSRMYWFTHPDSMEEGIARFLRQARFQRWGYFPVDSTGPGDKLSGICCAALQGYDRLLGYTKFGAGVLSRSAGRAVDWIPHGLDMDVFQPRDRKAARIAMGFKDNALVVGCNMTNQPRKDWGLWASICAHLKRRDPNVRFWAHIDVIERTWSLPALIEDYGLADNVKVTMAGALSDVELSYFYSACDVTMLPSLGEGHGFPIVESMACGVPCVHGNYAGGAELIPEAWRVDPVAWRVDTPYNCIRPVFDPARWAEILMASHGEGGMRSLAPYVEHLAWPKLWTSLWRKWFEEGLR